MATRSPDGKHILAAGEVGAYTVCPQAWKLKWIDRDLPMSGGDTQLGQKLHGDWSALFDESVILGKWIRYLVVLLCTAGVLFLLVTSPKDPLDSIFYISLRSHGLQLIVLAAATLLVIRSFGRAARDRRSATGFAPHSVAVSLEGSSTLSPREYISNSQGLAGKPDALVNEAGMIIPVERKPLAKKLRDRYAAQLLVYMRLVEEFEGIKPTHGYLLLGPSCRRVRVENSFGKQQWLQRLIDEMRGIIDGAAPQPAPHPVKCAKCDVRHRCSAFKEQEKK